MEEWTITQVLPDMEVDDVDGARIGTVARVHRAPAPADPAAAREDVVEVKTGLLGLLGKHWYIPASAIQSVGEGCIALAKTRAELDQTDWREKPPHLAATAD